MRQDGKPPESDLVQLDDLHNQRRTGTWRTIHEAKRHRMSENIGWFDRTTEAFASPPPESELRDGKTKPFRAVKTYYATQLPSPPPTVSPSSSPEFPNAFQANHTIKPK